MAESARTGDAVPEGDAEAGGDPDGDESGGEDVERVEVGAVDGLEREAEG